MRVEGEWIETYQLLKVETIAPRRRGTEGHWSYINAWADENLLHFEEQLARLVGEDDSEEYF